MKYGWLLLPLGLAGCATQAPIAPLPGAQAAATLDRYHWRLADARDAHGKRLTTLFVRRDAPVQLDFSEGRLAIGNLCNRMGASYTIDADTLRISRLASTLMACPDSKLSALDDEVAMRLEGVLPFAVLAGDAPRLRLITGRGETLLFDGSATAETRYDGPGENVFLEVDASAVPCPHPLIANARCLRVREIEYDEKGLKRASPGEWQNLYSPIEGYEHIDGVRNVLRLKRYRVPHPPADGSAVAYVLDLVVETETVQP